MGDQVLQEGLQSQLSVLQEVTVVVVFEPSFGGQRETEAWEHLLQLHRQTQGSFSASISIIPHTVLLYELISKSKSPQLALSNLYYDQQHHLQVPVGLEYVQSRQFSTWGLYDLQGLGRGTASVEFLWFVIKNNRWSIYMQKCCRFIRGTAPSFIKTLPQSEVI